MSLGRQGNTVNDALQLRHTRSWIIAITVGTHDEKPSEGQARLGVLGIECQGAPQGVLSLLKEVPFSSTLGTRRALRMSTSASNTQAAGAVEATLVACRCATAMAPTSPSAIPLGQALELLDLGHRSTGLVHFRGVSDRNGRGLVMLPARSPWHPPLSRDRRAGWHSAACPRSREGSDPLWQLSFEIGDQGLQGHLLRHPGRHFCQEIPLQALEQRQVVADASGPCPGRMCRGCQRSRAARVRSHAVVPMSPSFITGCPKIGKLPVITVSPATTQPSWGRWMASASSVSARPRCRRHSR